MATLAGTGLKHGIKAKVDEISQRKKPPDLPDRGGFIFKREELVRLAPDIHRCPPAAFLVRLYQAT